MEEREESELIVTLNGQPIGHTKKVWTTTGKIEGFPQSWRKLFEDGEAKRKELEAKWRLLPEQAQIDARNAAHFLGNLLHYVGASGISFDVMAAGSEHTLTIQLEKKNAD